MFKEHDDVCAFQEKFNVPMAVEPTFLDPEAFKFRVKFMQEELDEFITDHSEHNMHGAADALVDLAYVLHGTALMMGLPWSELWDEVQRANMAKERATCASQSKRGSALDVIKPEGWKAPDHTAALGAGPWPMLPGIKPKLLDINLGWRCAGDDTPSMKPVRAVSTIQAIQDLLLILGEDKDITFLHATVRRA